jgi:hypothetical protein
MKRHDVDLVSLIFGLIFAGAAGWYFINRYLDIGINAPNGGWFVAAALIVLGLLGVGASLRHNRDELESSSDTPDS